MADDLRKKCPYIFVILICIILGLLYGLFVKTVVLDIAQWSDSSKTLFLLLYHVCVIFLVWSLVISIMSDPGKVPTLWGHDLDNERARIYCLYCHVFKPPRSHHCSVCQRCVLNMDHHCPWINNCIGFYNRKAFMLLLFYTVVCTALNLIAYLGVVSSIISHFSELTGRAILATIAMLLNSVVFINISLFFKYHLSLVFNNQTTIEKLQLERQNKDPDSTVSEYDIGNMMPNHLGAYYNWRQVFGKNWMTWLIPIFLSDEGPSGDGIVWPRGTSRSGTV